MKAIEQYFHVVLFFLSLWMKSLRVTIEMKATEQYFPVVLVIWLYKVVLTGISTYKHDSPLTSAGLSLAKRPLLLTTGTVLSCSLASLRFLANNPGALSKLFPKLPSPRLKSFSDSSLRDDLSAGTQTPASSKCPLPSVCRLPRMTSSKARSSNAFFLLLRREPRGPYDVLSRGGDF